MMEMSSCILKEALFLCCQMWTWHMQHMVVHHAKITLNLLDDIDN